MATNVTVYDLDNYPDNSKIVSIDLKTVIPVGEEGDEKWVLQFYTTAYSDNTLRTAIPDIYIRDIKAGWAKSSGLVGIGGKFTLDSDSNTLGIQIDNSSNIYYIELETGNNMTSAAISSDMEDKIRAIPDQVDFDDAEYTSAYRNTSVEMKNGKFYIISGSMSPYYTGSDKSSVSVTASGVDTCVDVLGFNLMTSSEAIAGTAIKEALLGSNYTAGTSSMTINTGTAVVAGRALHITDGVNEDYFTALSGTTDSSIVIATQSTNGFDGVANSYVASEAKIQLLLPSDPDNEPLPYYTDIDGVVRWGIKCTANAIDFSS